MYSNELPRRVEIDVFLVPLQRVKDPSFEMPSDTA
jgi:hypothetical protein